MKKIIISIFSLFFIGLFVYSSYKIIIYFKENYENKKIQESLNEKVKIIIKDDAEDKKKVNYQIDFETLKKDNIDTKGYLEIKGTNINYVVVQGRDNNYYLNHNYNKTYNTSGWIFIDYRNKLDDTDRNIIIYGHSIRDGSMFGSLKNYFDEKWRVNEENQMITFVTEKGTYHYQVFSSYEIVPESYYITTNFSSENEFYFFAQTLKNRSNYQYLVELDSTDQILTLSTCNWSGSKRVVVHAKLIKEENIKKN